MSGDDWLDVQVPNAPESVTYRDAATALWGENGDGNGFDGDETVGQVADRALALSQARRAAAPVTGVPGGGVTLHAAITAELAQHRLADLDPRDGLAWCACAAWDAPATDRHAPAEHHAHLAERVLAVLVDRLPHTPPDQLATLIGGTVEPGEARRGYAVVGTLHRAVGQWVPDSPPAAPEPRQDT